LKRGALPLVVAIAIACSPREEIVAVSDDGAALLLGALNGDVCDLPITQSSQLVCERALCVWDGKRCGACRTSATVPTRVNPPRRGIVVQMLLVDPVAFRVRARSTCTPLRSCPNADPACIATNLNDALAGSIGAGLGYSGLKEENEVLPVLVAFEQADGVPDCDPSTLIECAGMGKRAGRTETDVLCASGNGGLALGQGSDPTRCPLAPTNGASGSACFVQVCDRLVRP
jgi:hypothetical protein